MRLMGKVALWVAVCGCAGEAPPADTATCTQLFGRPSATTGLGDDQCGPACGCGEGFVAPAYTDDDLAALRAWTLDAPFAPLTSDPYATPDDVLPGEAGVCAVVPLADSRYRLQTYATRQAAEADGALPTHRDGCGVCSTLEDLAAYLANPDLTGPVRACGLLGITQGEAANVACLRDLGFTEPCAMVWYYNTDHTRGACLADCLALLEAPYHEADGSLNACLQCDEDVSGPVFKAVAGRTRRNSGLASALCRPCDEVFPVVHRYGG